MQPRHTIARRTFTLIELLTVIAIAAVLMGVVAGAFAHKSKNTGAGVRMISRILYLARQEAISSRREVAVVFPDGSQVGYDDIAVATVYYDDNGSVLSPKTRGTSWFFLPGNSAFKHDSASTALETCRVETDAGMQKSGVKCVVFKPSGSLDSSGDVSFYVGPALESMDGTGDIYAGKDKHYYKITVNFITGRAETEKM